MLQSAARLTIAAAVTIAIIGGLAFELGIYPANSASATTSTATSSTSSTSSRTTSTVTSLVSPAGYCVMPDHRVFAPLPTGPLFLKVMTDQGAVIPNATILVNHTGGTLGSGKPGFASYCLHLRPNATGYAETSANDSLVSYAQYNITLVGYYQGDYRATLPPLFVPMNSTVYVSVVVPSGGVTEVTCRQATGACTTTMVTNTVSA
jgi:hypothetical protein